MDAVCWDKRDATIEDPRRGGVPRSWIPSVEHTARRQTFEIEVLSIVPVEASGIGRDKQECIFLFYFSLSDKYKYT